MRTRRIIAKPFCNLVYFERDLPPARRGKDSKVLIVAPMAGHYLTLLRGTVRDILPDHEVYVTEWRDARRVPRSAGPSTSTTTSTTSLNYKAFPGRPRM